MRRTS
jgi:Adenine-specific DNA methylase containing a Zn-ribbon